MVMYSLTQTTVDCIGLRSVTSSARYILGKRNVLADQLSHPDPVLPTEWSLFPLVFDVICKAFGFHHMDLFVTRANVKLPLYVSLVPDPMAWKQDVFHHC